MCLWESRETYGCLPLSHFAILLRDSLSPSLKLARLDDQGGSELHRFLLPSSEVASMRAQLLCGFWGFKLSPHGAQQGLFHWGVYGLTRWGGHSLTRWGGHSLTV